MHLPIRILLLMMICCVFANGQAGDSSATASGQQSQPSENGRWVVSGFFGANAGSMFQGYGEGRKRTAYPSGSLAFDWRMKRANIDLGFQLGVNKAVLKLEDFTTSTSGVSGDVTITAWRTVFGVRMMFHFDDNEKSDVYSGFRTGIKYITRKTDTGRYNYSTYSKYFNWRLEGVVKKHLRPSTQIVLLGYRRNISPNWAIGTEIAFGAPYYASLLVSYRVPKGEKN